MPLDFISTIKHKSKRDDASHQGPVGSKTKDLVGGIEGFDAQSKALAPPEDKHKSPFDTLKSGATKVGRGMKNALKVGAMAAVPAYGMFELGKAAGKSVKNGLKGSNDDAHMADMNALDDETETAHERVQREYGAEVALWLAEHCDGSEAPLRIGDKPPSKMVLDFVEIAERGVADARSEKELNQEHAGGAMVGLSTGARSRVAKDPFHYDCKGLSAKQVAALTKFGLTKDEITAMHLYSGQASYAMNKVLRGERRDEESIKAYLPWAMKLDSAMAKMPKTVRNQTMAGLKDTEHGRIDPNQRADKMLDIAGLEVYRRDDLTSFMAKELHKNWREGTTITNPSFFSTSVVKGSYMMALGVDRNIKVNDASGAVSMIDLSAKKEENEILFRPGTQMRITKILGGKNGALKPMPNPGAVIESADKLAKEGYTFEIDCVIDKAPPGDKTDHGAKGSGDSKVDDKAAKKAAQAAEDVKTVRDLLADSSFADLL